MNSRIEAGSKQDNIIGLQLNNFCGAPMEPGRFLHLAIGVAAALAKLHEQDIVHNNINPQNIYIDPENDAATITGYSTASHLPFDYTASKNIVNNGEALAYMSPEQTGRMNRVVDYRSDLYSVGVTFYELLAGMLPFQAGDALEWVHCHIARVPQAPADLVPNLSPMLSDIVMKLLAKTAEERYQTASGLKFDLIRCLDQWEAKRTIIAFPLGEGDISDRLLTPQRLYGREKDIEALMNAFDGVVEDGSAQLVMVAGYSGIGKTSLVHELYKPIVRDHGLFISGKFDQYKRNIPYATIAEAFRELVQQILTESDERITQWRQQLQRALGVNGQLIVDIIPKVELIIGQQPPLPQLPLTEAQNRFNMVFRQFLGVFTKEQSLVVFLDDLQWADLASLKLLEHIVTYPDTHNLLIIGAYRDNEVSPAHPLILTLDSIHKSEMNVETITLAALSLSDLEHIVADTFSLPKTRRDPLARLIYEKTGGNPFFAIQFLMTLHSENLVTFDKTEHRWTWDIDRIQAKGYTDNIIDLMVDKLQKLTVGTQQKLRLAACIGNQFFLNTLVVISDISDDDAREALWEALKEGVLLTVSEGSYTFLHDRVQQAAYSLIPEEQRMAVHLQIGRLMLGSDGPASLDEKVFDIVNQFNLGAELISDQEEKNRVAELNFLAGKRAKEATAYTSAINYFSAGMVLLADDSWQAQTQLTYGLYLNRAECEYLNGNHSETEGLLSQLMDHARSKMDHAAVARVQILSAMTQGSNDKAIEAAIGCLKHFEINIPPHPTWEQVQKEFAKVWENIGDRSIADLINLPDMTDPGIKTAMDVLSVTITPAVYTDKNLLILVLCHMVHLSLKFGITDASASGFVWFGVVLGGPAFREFKKAYRFGKLAYDLVERLDMAGQKGRVFVTFAALINPWTRHIKTNIDILRTGFDAALQAGDMTFACYGCQHLIVQLITKGDPLDEVYEESKKRLAFVQKSKFMLSEYIIISQQRLIQNMRGDTDHFGTFNDGGFDQDGFEAYLTANQANLASAEFRYYIRKLQARFMSADYEQALEAMVKAKALLWTSPSFLEVPEYYYYGALTLAALHDQASPAKKTEFLGTLNEHRKQFEDWPKHCPENFLNKYALICAEIARIGGDIVEAEGYYEQAIHSARENGFILNEGIANELAARFYRQRDFNTIANAYLREARACYLRWGAQGKVKQLDGLHVWLPEGEQEVNSNGLGAQIGHLDAIAVVKASQAISGEIVLSRLLETLMRTVIETAGAQKACLILIHGDDWTIEAAALVEGQEITVSQPGPPQLDAVLPLSVVNYVRRTRESIILDNACDQNKFASDPYILTDKPTSVLCLPLLRQANLIGILYLENNLAKGAFTADRIAVLELLAAQAAISLENSGLYLERTRAENALRLSEEKYRAIFNNSGTALIFIEEDMTISMCNMEFEKLSGYRKAELENGMKWTQFVAHKNDLERMKQYHHLRRVDPQVAPQTYEFQLIDKAGHHKDIVVTVATMPGMKQSLSALVDVSELKRAEEERVRLVTAVEQAGEGIIVADLKWLIHYVNPAFERMSGYTKHELINRHIRILRSGKQDNELFRETRDTLVRGEIWSGRFTNKKKDGSFYEVEVTVSPIRDNSGHTISYVGIHRDITHEVELERELRQAQKMEAIGTLAGGIAHDFNNILAAIVGYSQMAHVKVAPDSDEQHYLERVLQASYRATDLVRQILAFSRQTEQERNPVQINSIVKETLKLLRSSLPATIEIHPDIAIPAEESIVLADPTQIHQVLMNLCTNAAHAMHAHGGVLSVKLSAMLVDASLASRHPDLKPGPYVRLTVNDTGHGMETDALERIFDPFFTTKAVGQGTGMGLSVVQGIVKSYSGEITVQSEPGQGTTFEVFLPRIEDQHLPEDKETKELITGSERILFVDDEESLAELGDGMLSAIGYSVSSKTNSIEALEAFQIQPDAYDVVITDMTMPNMTGVELAREVIKIRPATPIIMCSGFSELIDAKRAKQTGIHEFIMKPYDIHTLAKAIRKVLMGSETKAR